MSNPFATEEVVTDPVFGGNPFDAVGIVASAASEAKESVLSEAGHIFKAAQNINQGVNLAIKNKNGYWLNYLKELGRDLLVTAKAFAKKAIQLALAKLVLEFCAMTINYIMSALIKAGGGKMDISSPNVYFTGNGQQPAAATPQGNPYGNYSRSPFEGGLYSQASSSVSGW